MIQNFYQGQVKDDEFLYFVRKWKTCAIQSSARRLTYLKKTKNTHLYDTMMTTQITFRYL